MLPSRQWVEDPTSRTSAPQILAVARQLGIEALDAGETVREAYRSGRPIYFDRPMDPHFTAAGNQLLAAWLHEQLSHLPGYASAP